MTQNKANESKARSNREDSDRPVSENRELQDSERLAAYRQSFFQSALPDLPEIHGYHSCWLTTSNPRDSIAARERLGYTAIKAHEIPGWEHATMKSGQFEGCISVNEMVAYKLPMNLYQAYMKETHHDRPLEEEEALSYAQKEFKQRIASESSSPVNIEFEEGFDDMGSAPAAPRF